MLHLLLYRRFSLASASLAVTTRTPPLRPTPDDVLDAVLPSRTPQTLHRIEYLAANSMEVLVCGQFLLESPTLATSGTELSRINDTDVMARINTRDANGNLRLFTSMGTIFPGGLFEPYYAAPFEPLGNDTPGNTVLEGELKKVVGKV
jgi:hypothetical protein